MLLYTLLFVFVVSGTCETRNGSEIDARSIFDININWEVDRKIENIGLWFQQVGLDPLMLPDVDRDFDIRPLLITYHGNLKLFKGWMQDLRTIYRSDNAYLNMKLTKWRFKIPLGFTKIEFSYDYKARLLLVRPKGGAIGNVKNIEIYIEVTFDIIKRLLSLDQFKITDIGKIKLKLIGNPLTDFWANAFIDVVTSITHETIVNTIEVAVQSALLDAIDRINLHLHSKNNSTLISIN